MPLTLSNSGILGVVGPGDLVPGALAYWGDGAYSRAALGRNVVQLRNALNATQDFATFTTGSSAGFIDYTAAAAFIAAGGGNGFVVNRYDQTGNNHDLVNGVNATQPIFTNTCDFNTLTKTMSNDQIPSLLTQPYSILCVARRTALFTTAGGLGLWNGSADGVTYTTNNNEVSASAPSPGILATATDNVTHVLIFVFNGASSSISVDGVTTTGDVGADSSSATNFFMGADSGVGLRAMVWEFGFWNNLAFSPKQIADLTLNRKVFWTI